MAGESRRKPAAGSTVSIPEFWNESRRREGEEISFSEFAVFLFGRRKTAAALAAFTRAKPSSCYAWLKGTNDPPGYVITLLVGELLRRIGLRLHQ